MKRQSTQNRDIRSFFKESKDKIIYTKFEGADQAMINLDSTSESTLGQSQRVWWSLHTWSIWIKRDLFNILWHTTGVRCSIFCISKCRSFRALQWHWSYYSRYTICCWDLWHIGWPIKCWRICLDVSSCATTFILSEALFLMVVTKSLILVGLGNFPG